MPRCAGFTPNLDRQIGTIPRERALSQDLNEISQEPIGPLRAPTAARRILADMPLFRLEAEAVQLQAPVIVAALEGWVDAG